LKRDRHPRQSSTGSGLWGTLKFRADDGGGKTIDARLATGAKHCGNCAAPLYGPYCAQCGQPAHASARSLSAVLHDAWHVLTHLDGRFWHTLGALLFRPGFLTSEYFHERRARYLPPVRLYLVVSLLFFALASLRPVGTAPGGEASRSEEQAPTGQTLPEELPRQSQCDVRLGLKALDRALAQACERAQSDGGASLLAAFTHNIPRMMFAFLPLMAALMMPFYWAPRRYYVEHLVYCLHTHSAIFLAITVQVLIGRLAAAMPALEPATSLSAIAVAVYVPWYVYAAMRRYYGQSRPRTLFKFAVIGLLYSVGLLLAVTATGVISMMTA
jgi:Protein of unknown function (DUF3667)